MGLSFNLGLGPEFSAQVDQIKLGVANMGRAVNGLPPLTELPAPPPEVLRAAVLPAPIPAQRPAKKPESGFDRFHAKHDALIFEIIRTGEHSGGAGKGWCSIAALIVGEVGFTRNRAIASRSKKVMGASYAAALRGLSEYLKKNADYFGL